MQTITTTERGVALVSLAGELALECLTHNIRSVTLRKFRRESDNTLTDIGAINLRQYDPNSFPAGNGYAVELRDHTRRTLLAAGVATQRGGRATAALAFAGVLPTDGDSITITYPDLSDEDVDPAPAVPRAYIFRTAPTLANEIRIAPTVQEQASWTAKAINGDIDYGDTYTVGPGTLPCYEIGAFTSTPDDQVFIDARDGGIWANGITLASAGATQPTWLTALMTGGTGRRGLDIAWEAVDGLGVAILPNSLMESISDIVRLCYFDVIGLNSNNRPTKLIAGPVDLHTTATDAT